jgi:ParB/RepB/Spo0J family partition protein
MQDSSAFQFLAVDQIHESTTNPRRTFDEAKLYELAESIKHNGLIQPITVRPNNQGFEIVAGARRYRAAQLAELFSVPARIVEIDDAKALEWQLVENSQRVDVHPYEEAQGFQRLLDIPGYDVAALVEKSGKSASHVYARLSLLQLIPTVAEAFTQERITASHATSSRVFRRRAKPQPSSSAGARTGKTKSRTCYPPSTLPRGYRPTSICPLRMRPSTAKTRPSTPPPELASPARAAADSTPRFLPTWFPTNASIQAATTAR